VCVLVFRCVFFVGVCAGVFVGVCVYACERGWVWVGVCVCGC
jgi:hypothetical protein